MNRIAPRAHLPVLTEVSRAHDVAPPAAVLLVPARATGAPLPAQKSPMGGGVDICVMDTRNDGWCQGFLNCAENGFDGGDCNGDTAWVDSDLELIGTVHAVTVQDAALQTLTLSTHQITGRLTLEDCPLLDRA